MSRNSSPTAVLSEELELQDPSHLLNAFTTKKKYSVLSIPAPPAHRPLTTPRAADTEMEQSSTPATLPSSPRDLMLLLLSSPQTEVSLKQEGLQGIFLVQTVKGFLSLVLRLQVPFFT